MSKTLGIISEERKEQLAQIDSKRVASEATLQAIMKAAMLAHSEIREDFRKLLSEWWTNVEDDLGLVHGTDYVHNRPTGEIRLDDGED